MGALFKLPRTACLLRPAAAAALMWLGLVTYVSADVSLRRFVIPDVTMDDDFSVDYAVRFHEDGRSLVFDEVALTLAKAMTRTPATVNHGGRQIVFLSMSDVFNAVDYRPLGRVHGVAFHLHASVKQVSNEARRISVWLTPVDSNVSVARAERTAMRGDLSRQFALTVKDLLEHRVPLTWAAEAINDFSARKWSDHTKLAKVRLERLIGRRLGHPWEQGLVRRALAQIEAPTHDDPGDHDVLLERYALVRRLARIAFGRDEDLNQSLEIATEVRTACDRSRPVPGFGINCRIVLGPEDVYNSELRVDDALRRYDEARSADDNLAQPHFFRGFRFLRDLELQRASDEAIFDKGDVRAIVQHFDQAIERNPFDLWAYAYKIKALGWMREWEEARKCFEAATAVRRDDSLVLYNQILAVYWQKRHAEQEGSGIAGRRPEALSNELRSLLGRLDRSGMSPQSIARLETVIAFANNDFESAETKLVEWTINQDELRKRYEDVLSAPQKQQWEAFTDLRLDVLDAEESVPHRLVLALLASHLGDYAEADRHIGGLSQESPSENVWATAAVVHYHLGLPGDAKKNAWGVLRVFERPVLSDEKERRTRLSH